jgi:hypothetical protein
LQAALLLVQPRIRADGVAIFQQKYAIGNLEIRLRSVLTLLNCLNDKSCCHTRIVCPASNAGFD